MLVHRSYRLLLRAIRRIGNMLFIAHTRLQYPRARLASSNRFARNCIVRCTDNSSLELAHCVVGRGTLLICGRGGSIAIRDVSIGENCVIVSQEKIEIGPHTQIAEMVVIRDQNHRYDKFNVPVIEQGYRTGAITIGSNVWLGAKVTVLAGSRIGDNCVVAAHSVVRGELEANCVYAGIPAKKIKAISFTHNA